MTTITHLIYIPFTGVGLHGGFRGNKWFQSRIELFKNYTLKSLINQTNKKFIIWLSLRKEEYTNPLSKKLIAILKNSKAGAGSIVSFEGLMYYDDKYDNFGLKTIIRNFLMMLWDCYRRKEIRNPFLMLKTAFGNKNKTLPQRLARALEVLKKELPVSDWIYVTRIDSDDMFAKDVIEIIQQEKPGYKKALIFKNGYILNKNTGQIAEWNPTTNPPFHTIIFPYNIFIDAKKHLKYLKGFKSHEDIPKIFNCIELPNNKYCCLAHKKNISTFWQSRRKYLVLTHNENIGTCWNPDITKKLWYIFKHKKFIHKINPFIGKEIQNKEILKDFGISS